MTHLFTDYSDYVIVTCISPFVIDMKELTQSIENAMILTSSKPSDAHLDDEMVSF
jgi:hypothetical protein